MCLSNKKLHRAFEEASSPQLDQGGREQCNDCISCGRISGVALVPWGWKVWEWYQDKIQDQMCKQRGGLEQTLACSVGH